MTIKRTIFNIFAAIIRRCISCLCIRRQVGISSYLLEHLVPIVSIGTDARSINFYCPNSICLWRAQTLLSKEPETIEWINTFDKDSVFWDVGANMGIYSLYAALRPNIKVLAFEPFAFNYYVLNKNIIINNMRNNIYALCIAFSDKTDLSYFNISDTNIGSALHYIGKGISDSEKTSQAIFTQGMISLSIDDFIDKFKPPFPNYIKIDVDGAEDRIIQGAGNTLSDKRLKSVLVELDSAQGKRYNDIDGFLRKSGMQLFQKRHAAMFDSGDYESIYNYIYVRI